MIKRSKNVMIWALHVDMVLHTLDLIFPALLLEVHLASGHKVKGVSRQMVSMLSSETCSRRMSWSSLKNNFFFQPLAITVTTGF